MSSASDSSNPPDSHKRIASPGRESDLGCPSHKRSRAGEDCPELRAPSSPTRSPAVQDRVGSGQGDGGAETAEHTGTPEPEITPRNGGAGAPDGTPAGAPTSTAAPAPSTAEASHGPERSDSAAFAAAEALASLTSGPKELPCSSRQALSSGDAPGRPACSSRGDRERQRDRERERGRQAEAAAADSSSSVLGPGPERDAERNDGDEDEDDEDDEDSLAGSSSTASSSVSENEEPEDGECEIVAVRMAPEVRQSVSLLAQVQMRLDALEKRGARLHQRLELKLSRQRRPHLDQRGAITQTIPGFWVTALLNHPHLSAHIDENDEDALSYMTNLEIETFKNNKLGYRICFHFRRNPFFQNKVIVKELHLGMGGSPVSFSNPILWHRGQSLTGNGEPRRTSRGVYQSFFHWFSDHTSPGRDDIAQILKDDLYRNPLRYYLTPLWEPRQNGSTPKPPDNSNGEECVIISDSDDEQEVVSQDRRQEREDEDEDDDGDAAAPDDSDQEAGSSFEEREEEELDVEEVEGLKARTQDQDEENEAEEDEEEETKRTASDST